MSENWRDNFATLRDQYRYVFQLGLYADVNINILCNNEAETIQSHSLVLKVRSPVFEKLLNRPSGTSGELREITVTDFSPSSFKRLIQFLYTDELDISDVQELIEVLSLAKKYKVNALTVQCAELLKSAISDTTVSSIIQAAREFCEVELEQKAFQYFMKNAPATVKTDDFTKLPQPTLIHLIHQDDLEIKEVEVFEAVMRWAKADCIRHKIQDTPKHIRLVLKEALLQIRFPLMTLQEIESKVGPSQLFNDQEIAELLKNTVSESTRDISDEMVTLSFGSISCKPRNFNQINVQPDLTKMDDKSHERLAKFALQNFYENNKDQVPPSRASIVSNVIVEILPKDSSVNLEDLGREIFKIRKYGLHWGAVNIAIPTEGSPQGQRPALLISFTADETRSYGVGTVIEEIQDAFESSVGLVYVRSYRDDIEVSL